MLMPTALPAPHETLPFPGRPQYLTEPVIEIVRFTTVCRNGPDPLHPYEFKDSPWPIRWAAYWYRNHALCAAHSRCRCRAPEGPWPQPIGDGLAVVAYMDGEFGLYSLDHPNGTSPLNWDEMAAEPRLTRSEFDLFRADGLDGVVPTFSLPGGETVTTPSAAAAVWMAADFAAAYVAARDQ